MIDMLQSLHALLPPNRKVYFRRCFEVFDLTVVIISALLTVVFVIAVDYTKLRLGVATIVLRSAACLFTVNMVLLLLHCLLFHLLNDIYHVSCSLH